MFPGNKYGAWHSNMEGLYGSLAGRQPFTQRILFKPTRTLSTHGQSANRPCRAFAVRWRSCSIDVLVLLVARLAESIGIFDEKPRSDSERWRGRSGTKQLRT
jgi:hypothetical protein